eukprot:363869-Chlamydomonas_euryale.AAC.24
MDVHFSSAQLRSRFFKCDLHKGEASAWCAGALNRRRRRQHGSRASVAAPPCLAMFALQRTTRPRFTVAVKRLVSAAAAGATRPGACTTFAVATVAWGERSTCAGSEMAGAGPPIAASFEA